MMTKIFGVTYLVLLGVSTLGVASVGSTILGLLALGWSICWIANA